MARIEIKAGDAIRVTGQATIMGDPVLLLWINNRPAGHITSAQAEELRKVVKDPNRIVTGQIAT